MHLKLFFHRIAKLGWGYKLIASLIIPVLFAIVLLAFYWQTYSQEWKGYVHDQQQRMHICERIKNGSLPNDSVNCDESATFSTKFEEILTKDVCSKYKSGHQDEIAKDFGCNDDFVKFTDITKYQYIFGMRLGDWIPYLPLAILCTFTVFLAVTLTFKILENSTKWKHYLTTSVQKVTYGKLTFPASKYRRIFALIAPVLLSLAVVQYNNDQDYEGHIGLLFVLLASATLFAIGFAFTSLWEWLFDESSKHKD